MTPFVSVVVPTRNRAKLLRDTVASLVEQDFPTDRYEVIVVDDGSVDETAAVIAAMQARVNTPALRYVRSSGRGPNAARNEGVQTALGDPVVFVDDDVDAPRSWLRELVNGCLRHPEAGCLGGRIRLRLEGRAPRMCGREPLGETELELGDHDKEVEVVWSANMAVRCSALGRVGLFREDLQAGGDEEEWEVRLRAAGGTVVYLPDAWLWHRRTPDTLRLLKLLGARFHRGQAQADSFEAIQRPLRMRSEISAIPRYLAHAIRRRCAWGGLAASKSAGRVCGLLGRRVSSLRPSLGLRRWGS